MIAIIALAAALHCGQSAPVNQFPWAFVLPARVECSPLSPADITLAAIERAPNPFDELAGEYDSPFEPDEFEAGPAMTPEVLTAEDALGRVETTLAGLVRP